MIVVLSFIEKWFYYKTTIFEVLKVIEKTLLSCNLLTHKNIKTLSNT